MKAGTKHTEESRRKISAAQIGRESYVRTEEHRRKSSAANLGRKHSEEAKRNMSNGQLGRKHTEESKRKIAEANKGRKQSEEVKRKLRAASTGRVPTEQTRQKLSARNKGRKHTEEARRKMTEIGLLRRGESNPQWKGGRSVHPSGYITVFVPDGLGRKGRHILEHRLVMQNILGRPLTEHESVHHKNGIRDDNRPENLEFRVRYHGRGATKHCPTCTCAEHMS